MRHLDSQISFDYQLGIARFGEVSVSFREERSGELRLGGERGPRLRPLAFGERNRIVARAVGAADSRAGVCAGILRAALVEAGKLEADVATVPTDLLETAALALAGAAWEAPSFVASELLVARASGWNPGQVSEADAIEVDRLAIALSPPAPETGWNRLLFSPPGADSLEALRAELADNLLSRLTSADVSLIDGLLVEGDPGRRSLNAGSPSGGPSTSGGYPSTSHPLKGTDLADAVRDDAHDAGWYPSISNQQGSPQGAIPFGLASPAADPQRIGENSQLGGALSREDADSMPEKPHTGPSASSVAPMNDLDPGGSEFPSAPSPATAPFRWTEGWIGPAQTEAGGHLPPAGVPAVDDWPSGTSQVLTAAPHHFGGLARASQLTDAMPGYTSAEFDAMAIGVRTLSASPEVLTEQGGAFALEMLSRADALANLLDAEASLRGIDL